MNHAHAEFERARAHGVSYVEPAQLGDADGRRIRMPARAGLAESYATQIHAWQTGGARMVVRPVEGDVPAYDDHVGAGWTRFILTAANPLGRPCTEADNDAAHEAMRARLADLGANVVQEITTMAPDRGWYEDAFLVTEVTRRQVAELAYEFGQPAYTVWTPETLTVEATGRWDAMPRLRSRWKAEPVARTCPMRADDHLSDRCAMRGGPWISASITAATLWKAHRDGLVRRLGCDACADGARPFAGPLGTVAGPIEIRPHIVASRYGGYAWLPLDPTAFIADESADDEPGHTTHPTSTRSTTTRSTTGRPMTPPPR